MAEVAKWYVVHTYSGYEKKVETNIQKMVENRGLHEQIVDMRVPEEIEVDNETKKETKRKLFPGYVFVKMIMSDESWHVVRNITGVTGFVGPGSEPTPLTDAEVDMFNVEPHNEEFKFEIGDKVEVVTGVFAGYHGVLQEISEDGKQLLILASTERRDIPIMVNKSDVRVVTE